MSIDRSTSCSQSRFEEKKGSGLIGSAGIPNGEKPFRLLAKEAKSKISAFLQAEIQHGPFGPQWLVPPHLPDATSVIPMMVHGSTQHTILSAPFVPASHLFKYCVLWRMLPIPLTPPLSEQHMIEVGAIGQGHKSCRDGKRCQVRQ